MERRFEQLLSQNEGDVFSIPIRDQKNLSAIMKALSLEGITFSVLPSECGWMLQMSMETYEDDLSLSSLRQKTPPKFILGGDEWR